MLQRSACLVFSTDTRDLDQFQCCFFLASLSFLAHGRQSGRQAKPGHSAACSPWLWSHHAAYARFACAKCHVEVRRAKSARLFVAKLRCDYADENALPDKAASGRGLGGAGRGGRGTTGCHLKKETANFVFFANKPCQPAQSQPHSPDSSSARQSSTNSRQLSVVCPQSSLLSPRSSIHSPASSVSSSLFMLSCAH